MSITYQIHQKVIKKREKYFQKALQIILLIVMIIWDYEAWSYLLGTRTEIVYNSVASIGGVVQADPLVSNNEREVIKTKQGEKSQESISQLITKMFPECPETMLAIAKAESNFKNDAVNVNKNGSRDCGIFQINSIHGYDCEWLKDPHNNLDAARKVYEKQGLRAWATYNYAIRNNLPI